MSLCHGTALKEIGGEDATDCDTWPFFSIFSDCDWLRKINQTWKTLLSQMISLTLDDLFLGLDHPQTAEETIDPQGLDDGTLHHLQTCSDHGFNRVVTWLTSFRPGVPSPEV